MKYLVFAFLFLCCYKVLRKNGVEKFLWLMVGMLMINSTYSPIVLKNAHFTLSLTYLASLLIGQNTIKDFGKYPLKKISIIIAIVYVIIAISCTWQSFPQSLYKGAIDYSISFLMLFAGYNAIKDNADYDRVLKVLKPIVLVSAVYGLFCFVLKDNPYNKLIGISEVGINYDFFETQRGYRIAGFCNTSNPHAHLLMVSSFLLINREKSKYNYILLILSLMNILLSDSRAPLADLGVLILMYFILTKDSSKKNKVIIYFICTILILFQIPFFSDFADGIIGKVTDVFASEGETEVSGSSMVLRVSQLLAAWNYFIQAPFFGHGFGYYGDFIFIPGTDCNGLWGMESYILWLMVEQGGIMIILACIFYASLYMSLGKYKKIEYYKIPVTLTTVLVMYLLLNRPTDVYEYYLPFIGIGLKLLAINKKQNKVPQLNTCF